VILPPLVFPADDVRVVIYDRHVFIVQATDCGATVKQWWVT
jgi:hypothetical protein